MKHASLIDSSQMKNNINKRRGACLQTSFDFDSGPIGLQYVPIQQSHGTADLKVNGQMTSHLSKTPAQCDDNSCFIPVLQDQQSEIGCASIEERDEIASVMLCASGTSDKKSVGEQTGVKLSQSPTNGQRAARVTAGSSSSESWASKAAVPRASLCEVKVNSDQERLSDL